MEEEEDFGGATVLAEVEGYRVWDVGSSRYYHAQTRGMRSGRLAFVAQGSHGTLSLVVVGGRRTAGGDDAEEVTFLIRACA